VCSFCDQGCRCLDGKQGHLSGAVGSEPALLMLIQLDQLPLEVAQAPQP
jgi:hypothetical protein